MKKLFLSATAIATVMSASAFAADLPSVKSAPAAPAPMWTGFYAGINSGYGFGTANNAQNYGWANPEPHDFLFSSFATNDVTAAAIAGANSYMGRNITQGGFIGGGQAGYNYQYGRNFVLGVEADMQGAGIGGQGSASGVVPFSTLNALGSNTSIQAGIHWMGTARGRIGYLAAPSVLLYATGGLAYGGTYLKTFQAAFQALPSYNVVVPLSFSTQNAQENLNVGWTAGGGAEWMMAPNWSIKGEALYYDLGNTSVNNTMYANQLGFGAPAGIIGGSTTRTYYQGVIARGGVNYHFGFAETDSSSNSFLALGSPVSTPDLPSIKSPHTTSLPIWAGFYAGLNSGYGFGTANNAQHYGWANPASSDSGLSAVGVAGANSYMGRNITQGGFIGGGQAGYNYQYGRNFVLGVEADMQGAGIGGQGSASGVAPDPLGVSGTNFPIQAGISWIGTARGRIGYLLAPSVLLYATGGLAYGGTYLKTFPSSYGAASTGSISSITQSTQNAQENLNVGWTAGGGAEWMMAPNWSIKGEALYYDLGNTSVINVDYIPFGAEFAGRNPVSGSTTRAYYQGVIARMGINYHFDLEKPAPVVAKF